MKKRKYLWISFVTMFLTSISLTMMSIPVSSSPTTLLSAEIIADDTLAAGSTFQINITIADVSSMWGFQFNLTYDTTVLTATSYQSYSPFTTPWPSTINDTAGYVSMGASSFFGDPTGLSTVAPVPIAGINFTVDAEGDSLLDLHDSVLSNVLGQPIPHKAVDGYISSEPLPTHNIAVTDVTINVTETETVLPGVIININVTVLNKGSSAETFNVTTYFNTTSIDTKTITSLPSLTVGNLTFYWNTTDLSVGTIYKVKAIADVTGDADLTDNEFVVDGFVQLGTRDVAIIGLAVANVTKPNPLLVNVTVKNEGNMTETFNVTAFYGIVEIGVQTVTLSPGSNTTLTFTLNTTGIEVDDYAIEAKALPGVPTETDLNDNTMSGGIVHIGVPSGYPEAHFSYLPYSPLVGEEVTFDASASTDLDGVIDNYAWDFGDGTTAIYIGANLTDAINNTYTERGTFTVTLTVTDNASQPDIAIHDITILDHDIAVIDITAQPTQASVGEDLTITVTVENQGDFTETFNISIFYDTTLIDTKTSIDVSVTVDAKFTWSTAGLAAGTYDIRAETTPVQNETDTADNSKTVASLVTVLWPPVASFTYSPAEPLVGETVTFNASLSTTYGGATIVSYTWNFGDGTTAIHVEGVNLTTTTTNTYDTHGTYTANLTVTDSKGLSNSTTQDITVKAHDIAVTSVVVSTNKVTIGESVSIDVTVENQGDFTETFDVSVYYNNTEIETQTVTSLAATASETLTFTWATTGIDEGNYAIKAVAETVAGETDTDDNTKTSSETVSVEAAPAPSNIVLYAGVAIAAIVIIVAVVYFMKIRK